MNAPAFSQAKFERGQLLVSRNIAALLERNPLAFWMVTNCLTRHLSGDCGDMCIEDKAANEEALLIGARVFSAYETPEGKIWIITEADRSATTVLFPEEY